MIRRTLAQVEPELARIAGTSGLAVTDARFLRILNRATQELANEGEWPGVVDRYRFWAYGGEITLPGDLERVLHACVDGTPIEMRSPWYEFVAGGPGLLDANSGSDTLLDRGESCLFRDVPSAGLRLKVACDLDERVGGVRPKIILNGYGDDGRYLRSVIGGEQADGIEVELNGDASPKSITTSINVRAVESVIKPVTKGYVSLYATDGTTDYHLATYAPRETTPSYRRYLVPFVENTKNAVVVARVRRRFYPLVAKNDFLLITNLPALEAMIIALHKREADDLAGYAQRKLIAVDLMRKEAKAYRGETRRPAVTFATGAAIGDIPHVR
jgi:hypothetical protein